MTSLTLRGVTRSFGSTEVLSGVDLHVPERSLTAVLGPSGCGKTTLLRLVAGFDDPDAGEIRLGTETVFGAGRSRPPQRRRVGYVPQEGALFPHLSVAANVSFGLSRRDRTPGRVAELLELVGLAPELAARAPHELSGGQQQRVALARALAPGPALVLLDEPFSSLDAALRDTTRRAVGAALAAAGATAVLVTHDQAEALSLADQVAVMRGGRLVQLSPPSELYGAPADPGVARFVGEAVLLPASVRDGVAVCALGSLPVPESTADGPVEVLLRPEQICLGPDGVPATVLDVSYFGHDAAVRLRLTGGDGDGGPEVLARVPGHTLPRPGTTVHLTTTGPTRTYPLSSTSAPAGNLLDLPPALPAAGGEAAAHRRAR